MKKILSLFLAVLTLTAILPMAVADSIECDHKNAYEVKYIAEGSDEKYFLKCDISKIGDYRFYICPDCQHFSVSGAPWDDLDSCDSKSYFYSFGICPPGACAHHNVTELYAEPTCRGMYLDMEKATSLLGPNMPPELLDEIINNYGKAVAPSPSSDFTFKELAFCCNDCGQLIAGLETGYYYSGDEIIFTSLNSIAELIDYDDSVEELAAIGMTREEAIEAGNACIKAAEPHKYVGGKCVYCEQAEPTQPAAPEEPEPSENTGFFEKILNFFRRIIDWIKELFTF